MKYKINKIEGNKIFVNEDNQELELAHWVKPEFVKLGSAELTLNDKTITFCKMEEVEKPKSEIEIKDSNIVKIKGKDFMTYAGLLDQAHKKGLISIEILESWVSEDMTKAWCKVRANFGKKFFDGFGSSTPENTGAMTQSHPVEMANTRAKGRALRDFLNIGTAMLEELKKE